MAVASFALVEGYSSLYKGQRGILFTNEHSGKYGRLLPGGRLNEEESSRYDEGNPKAAALTAVVREVDEELRLLFIPDGRFVRAYEEVFQGEVGTAWYWSGKLYSNAFPVTKDRPQLSSPMMEEEIDTWAREEVRPLDFLTKNEIKSNVRFKSMVEAASEYLSGFDGL